MSSTERSSSKDALVSPVPGLDLRLLRYVIAVAEELHFTKASMRLHLATPSLSRQIHQLEQAIGYALFERQTRTVALTPAGFAFVTEARRALLYARRAVEAGAVANSGRRHALRVGYTPLLCAVVLTQIDRTFMQTMDGVPLHFQSMYSVAQIDQILGGRLDVGLVALPVATNDVHTDRLFRSRLVAAIPEDSELAASVAVGPKELAGQPIIWFERFINPPLYQYFVDCCQQAGFAPNIVYEVSTAMEILDSVAAGMGISFVKDTVPSRFRPQGVAFRELAVPELALDIGVAYRVEDRTENLLTLLQVLKQLSDRYRNCGSSAVDPGSGCLPLTG